jgi:hypothetical protein
VNISNGSATSKVAAHKALSADGLIKALRTSFEVIDDPFPGVPEIPLADALMSAYAVFSLKAPSLLDFERRRTTEESNLKSIYGMAAIPCDTQMRARLDEVDPDSLRPAYKAVFNKAEQEKILENMAFLDGCVLISNDGTGYFSSDKLHSPVCLEKKNSKTGQTTYHLQMLGSAIVHPDRKEVIPLPPEPIRKQDGANKNDCERNASRRWLQKFRQDHPHLKVIIVEDGLGSNAPHIRDLQEHRCHFILGSKEGDHAYLSTCLDKATARGETTEFDVPDPKDPKVRHFFRFANGLPLNESNRDILVNIMEYWEIRGEARKYFCWITDLTITTENAYQIMRGGRARWKVENETFNTLKNQGYHIEHNYGLGKKNLSMVFVTLMMLAFLVDQILQMSPSSLFSAALKKAGTKRDLWEKARAAFYFFEVPSMETIYRLILAGRQKIRPQLIQDSS